MNLAPQNNTDTLSIRCFDEVTIKARVTFDECTYRGVHVTFWSEETEESAKILDDVFDILFDEVVRNRKKERGGEASKSIPSIIEK